MRFTSLSTIARDRFTKAADGLFPYGVVTMSGVMPANDQIIWRGDSRRFCGTPRIRPWRIDVLRAGDVTGTRRQAGDQSARRLPRPAFGGARGCGFQLKQFVRPCAGRP
jgi:hypothetical protein